MPGKTINAMKRILTTFVILAVGLTAFAQYGPGHYGGRPGGGYSHGYGPGGHRPGGYYAHDGVWELGVTINHFSKAGDTFRPDKLGFFGEYRVDVTPYVDLGVQLYTTFGKGGSYLTNAEPGSDLRFWQGAPLVVTDVNLMPYSALNPYFGLAFGPGFGYMKHEFADKGEWTQALVLNPRAGIELFECLRLSVHYQWYLNNWSRFSHWGMGISWAFGGRGGRARW
jgi:hypothetical protein